MTDTEIKTNHRSLSGDDIDTDIHINSDSDEDHDDSSGGLDNTLADDSGRVTKSKKPSVHDVKWDATFQLLVEYKNKHGSTNVPQTSTRPEYKKLANWVRTQRSHYFKGKLSGERIGILESIGFQYEQNEDHWIEMYNQLVFFTMAHDGSSSVPHRSSEYKKLGNWIRTQRRYYSKGKLSGERIGILESIGFQWRWYEQNEDHWIEMYNQLVFFTTAHNGSFNVPHRSVEYKKLGNWIRTQRRHYFNGKLSGERTGILESIGFQWRLVEPSEDRWIEMYDRLVAYKTKHGTTRVPVCGKEDPKLGRWVSNQRYHCRNPDRIKLLNDIDFIWNAYIHVA